MWGQWGEKGSGQGDGFESPGKSLEPPGPLSSPAPVPQDGNSSWDPSLTPGLGPCGDLGHLCRATLSSLVASRHRDVAVLGMSPVLGCPRWFWGLIRPPSRGCATAALWRLLRALHSVSPGCPQGVPNVSPPLDPTPWSGMGLGMGTHSGLTPKPLCPLFPPKKRDGIITPSPKIPLGQNPRIPRDL